MLSLPEAGNGKREDELAVEMLKTRMGELAVEMKTLKYGQEELAKGMVTLITEQEQFGSMNLYGSKLK